MKANIAAVGLACPFEVGFDNADHLLNQTVETLVGMGVACSNAGVVMHDLETVKKAADALKKMDADVLLICIATWSEDHHLLKFLSLPVTSIKASFIHKSFPFSSMSA